MREKKIAWKQDPLLPRAYLASLCATCRSSQTKSTLGQSSARLPYAAAGLRFGLSRRCLPFSGPHGWILVGGRMERIEGRYAPTPAASCFHAIFSRMRSRSHSRNRLGFLLFIYRAIWSKNSINDFKRKIIKMLKNSKRTESISNINISKQQTFLELEIELLLILVIVSKNHHINSKAYIIMKFLILEIKCNWGHQKKPVFCIHRCIQPEPPINVSLWKIRKYESNIQARHISYDYEQGPFGRASSWSRSS